MVNKSTSFIYSWCSIEVPSKEKDDSKAALLNSFKILKCSGIFIVITHALVKFDVKVLIDMRNYYFGSRVLGQSPFCVHSSDERIS